MASNSNTVHKAANFKIVEGSQWRILQIRFFQPYLNPQTTRVEHFDVHSKSFSLTPHLTTFCSNWLVSNATVDGKDNLEEKTREVVDIRT